MLQILVMAGGKGERFWPMSREKKPKQFLNLSGFGTLLQETVWRAKELVGYQQIYIATIPAFVDLIQQQLPEIPAENIIIEPEGRNTAPCIGLASVILGEKDPEGTLAILPADHIVQKKEEYLRILRLADTVAKSTAGVVTLGIRPERPEIGYGYIELAEPLSAHDEVYRVHRFVEKPPLEMAQKFVIQGRCLWNSGMFIQSIRTMGRLIQEHMPRMYTGLEKIRHALGTKAYETVCQREYAKFDRVSVDVGIMEKAHQMVAIPADIGWDDLGSWSAISRWLPEDAEGNRALAEVLAIDSRKNLLYSPNKLVVALGVDGLMIVETEDCILVSAKERDQEIRSILEELKRRGWNRFL